MGPRSKAFLKLVAQRAKRVGLIAADAICLLPVYMMCIMPARPMTAGEKKDIGDIFGKALDTKRVRIHSSPEMDNLMAPRPRRERTVVQAFTINSTIVMGTASESKDYAADWGVKWTPAHEHRGTFIHENTHVWHAQNCPLQSTAMGLTGYFAGLVRTRNQMYRYYLQENKDLLDYAPEQQASIIKDFYGRVREGFMPEDMLNDTSDRAKMVGLYKGTLRNFAANPAYIQQNCSKLWKLQ